MKASPAIIGALAASCMIVVILLGFYHISLNEFNAQWIAYGVYGIGVAASLYLNRAGAEKFGDYFSLGFRCFVVITLLLVAFTAIFNYGHPELASQSAELYKADLLKAHNRTPSEIENDVKLYQEGFATAIISRSIFGYLIFGALATAISSFLLTLQKR